MKESQYIKIVFAIGLGFLMFAATVNFATNPLGIYGSEGVFPAASTYSRIHKIESVKRLKPDVIITGSSRADIGLNPKEEFFPGLRPYNFALSAATIHEQRRTLEFAQTVHPLKKAVITLDFFAFNALKPANKQFEPARLSPEALRQPRAFFDTYGTAFSLDTLVVSLKHYRYMKRLERYSYARPNGHKLHNDGAWTAAHRGAYTMFAKPPAEEETATNDYSFGNSFEHLRAMLDLARENKIDTVLVISPVHETELERMKTQGQWSLFLEWKKRLAETAGDIPLWDFATYNSITMEKIPAPRDKKTRMRWFWDTNHYKEELGDLIFKKIYGLPGSELFPDFGLRL